MTAVDASLCEAAERALAGAHTDAAAIVNEALTSAPGGSAAWLLPIEPLLHVAAHPDAWSHTLARLRNRAV
jgi:hypothetical protein